jgi:hypothetical protein
LIRVNSAGGKNGIEPTYREGDGALKWVAGYSGVVGIFCCLVRPAAVRGDIRTPHPSVVRTDVKHGTTGRIEKVALRPAVTGHNDAVCMLVPKPAEADDCLTVATGCTRCPISPIMQRVQGVVERD